MIFPAPFREPNDALSSAHLCVDQGSEVPRHVLPAKSDPSDAVLQHKPVEDWGDLRLSIGAHKSISHARVKDGLVVVVCADSARLFLIGFLIGVVLRCLR